MVTREGAFRCICKSMLKDRALPLRPPLASGNEKYQINNLLQHLPRRPLEGRMTILEADKGYDAGWLRQMLQNQGVFPLLPYRHIQGRVVPDMKTICNVFKLTRKRWMVERAFA